MARYFDSEACFRNYEKYITEACLTHPTEVFFRRENVALSTDEARCRDAIASFRVAKWSSTVDAAAYSPVLENMTALAFMGMVVICSKDFAFKLRKKWKAAECAGQPNPSKLEAGYAYQIQVAFESEKREVILEMQRKHDATKKPATGLTTTPAVASMTEVEFAACSIEDAVDHINEGRANYTFVCDLTAENETRVREAVTDKLNVAFIIDSVKNQIKII